MVRRSTRTTYRRPGMLTRLRARANRRGAATTTTTTTTTRRGAAHGHHHGGVVAAAPVRRRATIGDKVSGALMKIRGSLTRRPGLKAAGTRRMHGTDGLGSHRAY